MGLDQYLKARRYFSTYSTPEKLPEIKKVFPEIDSDSITIEFEVGYWRKQNAIHKWFVDNCQDGKDECQDAYVSIEDLRKLKELCLKAIKDISKAEELLPTTSGFFFGDTEYGEWYTQGLKDTIDIVDKCEKLLKQYPDISFEYHSSW